MCLVVIKALKISNNFCFRYKIVFEDYLQKFLKTRDTKISLLQVNTKKPVKIDPVFRRRRETMRCP